MSSAPSLPDSAALESRYQATLSRLPSSAVLLAVSKGQDASAIEALYRLGHRDFGENYVQELQAKAAELGSRCPEIRWHFIGHLQTNKVKALAPIVHAVHTVDSEKLARELARRCAESGRSGRLPVFIEVNIDLEASKAGLLPESVPALAQTVAGLEELELQGLMCIPAPLEGPEDEPRVRAAFQALRALEERCRPWTRGKLSMGMSSDYPLALAEGATHVRVGTALFGPRKPRG